MAQAGLTYDGGGNLDSASDTPMSMIKNSPRDALEQQIKKRWVK